MSEEAGVKDIDDKTMLRIISLTHQWTGITLTLNKKIMVQGRLRSRMRDLKITSYAKYLEHLESQAGEKELFVELITTNETYFYRTPRVWEYLEKEFIPQWISKNPGKVFNAWSAAASSGEESYTLAAHLQLFKEKHPGFQYQIYGTDISKDILAVAEKATYSGRSIEMFREKRPDLFHKCLRKNPDGVSFTVAPEIRSQITFQNHNLFETPKTKTTFDLVLVRNVLIYFEGPDQEKVLFNISRNMKSDGLLVIGESESLTRLQTPFNYHAPLIYNRKAA
jgi:chemotaxis protein methyltransferase CheR